MEYLDEFKMRISLVDGMLIETGGQFGKRYLQNYIEKCLEIAQKYYEDTKDKNNLLKVVNFYIAKYEDQTSWKYYQYEMEFLNALKVAIEKTQFVGDKTMTMYKISKVKKEEIPELIEIWHNQYSKYCNDTVIPDFLSGGENSIRMYLENQISHGNAIISKKDDVITGYMAWMYIDFHNEKSAFCPIIGHAAIEEDSQTIYHELYSYAAQIWVDDDRFNHLWMIYNDNHILKDMLYDIGFGSHVIDAYIKVQKSVCQIDSKYKISIATYSDAEALLKLIKESVHFYIESPIFLKRGVYELHDVIDIIKTDDLFVAWDNDTPIGIMNLSVQTGYNIENLSSTNTGLISKVGAYIKPEYRGLGIGKCLLNEVMKHCAEKNIQYLHVCFETANPFANIFWRKHFKPIILSVRRTVNKDANITKSGL